MLNQIKNIDSIRASYGVEAVFLLVGIWFNWNLILYILVVENFILFKSDQDKSLLKNYKDKFELD